MTTATPYFSTCCQAEVKAVVADEGTNYMVCTKCGKPCDFKTGGGPVPASSTTPEQQRQEMACRPSKKIDESYRDLNPRRCSISGCGKAHKAKGLCRIHYMRTDSFRAISRASHRKLKGNLAYQQRKREEYRTPAGNVRRKASDAVQSAIKSGRLTRMPCHHCGKAAQAHHANYYAEFWLQVEWLCPVHHKEWHMNNKAIYPSIPSRPCPQK